MFYAFIFFGLLVSSSLVPVNANYPLAVGGHGTIFFNASVPLARARAWIEVETPSGWGNATFPNATEVILNDDGTFELEAIVGDARRRDEIKGLRLFLADSISGQPCWYRDVDLEYMYMYKPGRRPTRPFSANFSLIGPTRDGANEFNIGFDTDTCFHQRLAVDVQGTIMCNESTPMAFAPMVLLVLMKKENVTKWWPLTEFLDGSSTFMTAKDGSYAKSVSPGPVKDRDEIEGLRLWFENKCGVKRSPKHADFPVDYMYAYEEGYDSTPFIFNPQLDKEDREHAFAEDTSEALED